MPCSLCLVGGSQRPGSGETRLPQERLERNGRIPRDHLSYRHLHLPVGRIQPQDLRHPQGVPPAQDPQAAQVRQGHMHWGRGEGGGGGSVFNCLCTSGWRFLTLASFFFLCGYHQLP